VSFPPAPTPEVANTVFAGPASGPDALPTFRALVDADIPWDSMTGGLATPDYIQMDVTPTGLPADQAGLMYWNTTDGAQTLNIVMAGGDVVQQVGQELYYRVKASSAITTGQVVMFSGVVGMSGQIQGAPATGLAPSQGNYIMGVASEDIPLNEWGYVTAFGFVRNVNTTGGAESWVSGDILYWNPAVAGGLTKVIPTAPNARVEVAAVVTVGSSNGELLVRVTHGSTLGSTDSNVQFGTLASGDLLIYNATAGYWTNNTLTAGTGVSVTPGAGSVTVTNTAPDQVVSLTQGGTTTITGTYPNFTISSADQYVGTVTSVSGTGTVSGLTLTGTVTTSGSLTLGGTLQIARYLQIIAVSSTTALTNGTDIIGAVEIPVSGTITNIRAKTTSGTATVTFKINGSSIGSVNATSAGVSTVVSSAVTALDDLTLDVSSASGSGLFVSVTIQE